MERGRTAHGRPPGPTVRGRLDDVSGDLALGRVLGDGGGGRVDARALDGRVDDGGGGRVDARALDGRVDGELAGRGVGAEVLCLWSYDLSCWTGCRTYCRKDKYSGIARVAHAHAITLAARANTRRGLMARRPAHVR